MSSREMCISIINDIDEGYLANVAAMLQNIKAMLDERLDDAYCAGLYAEYLNDPDPEKHETISLQDYAKELGIPLS